VQLAGAASGARLVALAVVARSDVLDDRLAHAGLVEQLRESGEGFLRYKMPKHVVRIVQDGLTNLDDVRDDDTVLFIVVEVVSS
jgi:hypothetical protein